MKEYTFNHNSLIKEVSLNHSSLINGFWKLGILSLQVTEGVQGLGLLGPLGLGFRGLGPLGLGFRG